MIYHLRKFGRLPQRRAYAPQSSAKVEDSIDSSKIVEWLLGECHIAGDQIQNIIRAEDQAVYLGSGAIALAISVAIGANRAYLLMALPFFFSTLIAYSLFHNNGVMALAGYKKAIEEEVERRSGVPISQFESRIVAGGHNRIHVVGSQLMIGIILLALDAAAVAQALGTMHPGRWGHPQAPLYIAATGISILIGSGVIVTFLIEQENTRKHAYLTAKKAFDGALAQIQGSLKIHQSEFLRNLTSCHFSRYERLNIPIKINSRT